MAVPDTIAMSVDGDSNCDSSTKRNLAFAVLLAQVLSVALATTGVSSQALTQQGVYAPTTQAFLNYCLLALVFGTSSILIPWTKSLKAPKASHLHAGHAPCEDSAQWRRLRRLWPAFAALALIDVEANVLVTKAYQYTSLTSVTLLDCFTIPCVMLLSWLLLRAKYKVGHYLGAVCCIAGLAVLVLGDSQGSGNNHADNLSGDHSMWLGAFASLLSSSSAGSSPVLGDTLVLLGAMLYGVCNVTQELLLADIPPGQLLALLGLFGAVISGFQAALLEHSILVSAHWTSLSVVAPMAGFAAAMFAFYSLVPQVLMLGGATVLNLGLLTSDGWAALARFLWFGGFEGWSAYFFVGSLLLVATGLLVFTLSGSPRSSIPGAATPASSSAAATAAPLGQQVAYSRLIESSSDVEEQTGRGAPQATVHQ